MDNNKHLEWEQKSGEGTVWYTSHLLLLRSFIMLLSVIYIFFKCPLSIIKYVSNCFEIYCLKRSAAVIFCNFFMQCEKKFSSFDLTKDSFEFTSTFFFDYEKLCQISLYSLFPCHLFQNCFLPLYAITFFPSWKYLYLRKPFRALFVLIFFVCSLYSFTINFISVIY